MSLFSVCVYCGSRGGRDPAFLHAATELGAALARAQMRLVYGAGDLGLMGAVARAAHGAGGDTFGVVPTHLLEREAANRDLNTFIITETMHERKKVMVMNADAIVVLPGGAGTLDEFCEVLTWRQLDLHTKPIFILDVKEYWQPLIALIDHVIGQGFAENDLREFFEIIPKVLPLMERLEKMKQHI